MLHEVAPDLLRVPVQKVVGVCGSGEGRLSIKNEAEGRLELALSAGVLGMQLRLGGEGAKRVLGGHGRRQSNPRRYGMPGSVVPDLIICQRVEAGGGSRQEGVSGLCSWVGIW